MHQARLVGRVERSRDRADDACHTPHRRHPLGLDQLAQIGAVDQPHRDVEQLAFLPGVVDRDHVGVVDRRRQARFAPKALTEDGVGREARGDHLQRPRGVERYVARPVDDTHPAAAELGLDPVAGELRSPPQRAAIARVVVPGQRLLAHRCERLHQQAQVEGRRRMGQRSDGDEVDARWRRSRRSSRARPPRGLELNGAATVGRRRVARRDRIRAARRGSCCRAAGGRPRPPAPPRPPSTSRHSISTARSPRAARARGARPRPTPPASAAWFSLIRIAS